MYELAPQLLEGTGYSLIHLYLYINKIKRRGFWYARSCKLNVCPIHLTFNINIWVDLRKVSTVIRIAPDVFLDYQAVQAKPRYTG